MLTQSQQLQSYYLALFGRAADPDGLAYWQGMLDSGSVNVEEVLTLMLQSDEFADQAGGFFQPGNVEWVDLVYERLFARQAESEAISYWSGQAAVGHDSATLLKALMASASVFDVEAMDAYSSIANFYSTHVSAVDYDPSQQLVLDGFRSNEQLYDDLHALDEAYAELRLDIAGESLEGRPLYTASVGEGGRQLMIVTQQHGDEPTGTEAAMLLLEWLSGDSETAQALREQVTVTVMPRVNPDGFERWEKLLAGELDPELTTHPRRNSADIDLNRTWDAQEVLDFSLIPETVAMRSVIASVQPDLILDYHNQNNYLNEREELETLSLLWPTNESVSESVTAFSQQSAVALLDGASRFDYGYISLFPGGDTPQIARNGAAIDGVPTLLVEQRGLEEFQLKALEGLALDFDAVSSAVTLEGLLGMLGVLEALAKDGFESIDPSMAELIPDRGTRAPFDELYAAANPMQEELSSQMLAVLSEQEASAAFAGINEFSYSEIA
ncbi:M14 family zinc carboxypeptidase [Vreelandella stevensii]|uniref:M14 family zinc carboxypeptidase n=1 Tax=Vreelandella stevensii TaxID=502821 RepID=UPI00374A1AF5